METIAEIEPAMLEETRRIVEKEMRQFHASHPEDDYFDNWYLNLPGSNVRDQVADDLTDFLDETGDKSFSKGDITGQKHHSELHGRKTWRDFYADIDKALEKAGAPIEVVRDAVQSIQHLQQNSPGNPEILNRTSRLNNFTFDAFTLLRAMGYNRFDLTA